MSEPGTDYSVVRALQSQVAEQLTAKRRDREAAGQTTLSEVDERQLALSITQHEVADYIRSLVQAGHEPPDTSMDLQLTLAVDAAMYGAGELQELLDDPDIEDVNINGADRVWITYADDRGKVAGRPVAGSDEDLVRMVQNLASYAGVNARPWTRNHPTLDLRLPGGTRLTATMSATERPTVSIRRNRFPQITMAQLVELGTVSEELTEFFSAAIGARMNIIIAGETGAGKTTLARAFIDQIPPSERLIVIEEALELGVGQRSDEHPDVVEMERVLPDPDGRGGLSMDDLVARSRRHDPDRVIVGEVMGPEVIAMLTAMSQGNDGSISTVHARSAAGVVTKLCTYAVQHNQLGFDVTKALIAESVDFMVFVRKARGQGSRRVVSDVIEVSHYAGGEVATSRIFTPGPDGGAQRAADVPLIRGEALADAGYIE